MTIPNHLKLGIRTEIRAFLKLAIPLASAQVAQLTTGFADTVMMGHLGNEILAAGALASITFFSIMIATSGIVMGVVSALSHARPIFWIVTIATGFNIMGSYVLGFGVWGFPRLELAGLALASTFRWWGMFGALIIYLSVNEHFKDYQFFSHLHRLNFSPANYGKI
ncbi:hypothetical protein A5482_011395 [Cyanobacterium sp. IPPAS B-1200]|uniref:hypothetical protein n=1 Tax=Cyanobacterium sp. IPPAS B-1200 TaxID=1562720 RepID=UPI00085250D7|nr:hypothetical protein [Cyanobacterium sp. IPPAS B-1200]OEJ80143.1 hypothetical protein A5482_07560 [Cyanobacterium sp. IPPAS B-1200]